MHPYSNRHAPARPDFARSQTAALYQGFSLPFIEDGWTSIYYILDGVARAPVSFFFAERAWSMAGKNKIFGALLAVLIIASVASCILAKVFATGFTRDSLTTPVSFPCCHSAPRIGEQ